MSLTKMSKLLIFSIVIILIISEVFSTPLDSKFKKKRLIETATNSIASSTVQQRNDVIYPLINSFSSLILPRNINTTTLNQTEFNRRQQTVKVFIHEILKSIKNVTPHEIRARIEKYLADENSPDHKTNDTQPLFLGNSNNHNYYNDTENQNEKLLRNSKFIGGDVPHREHAVRDDDDDDDIIRRNFDELLRKEIKRMERLNRRRRQDDDEEEEDDSDEDRPSGLAGLFATLSGGEEGSDVGALVGALSTLITNLFGPGGLDLTSVLATGTSLISGLLSGDENFGKVAAGYLTTVIDGFSGGGGAETNGLFFGNFVGGLLAGLSADPEESSEEELPPTPGLFIQSFIKGYKAAGRKEGMGDESESKGSDSSAFIKHIVSSIASGSTSIIAQGSIGSSGGSSQGSGDASAASSGHRPKGDDAEDFEERRLK